MYLSTSLTHLACFVLILAHRVSAQNHTSLVVVCSPFEHENNVVNPSSNIKNIVKYKSTTDYCVCTLNVIGSGLTAIVKCDFEFKESVVLTGEVFPFKKWKVSSAYVRMTNALGAIVKADFMSSLMDAPSSAIDLWHCGQVSIESTPDLLPSQIFSDFKTFIGAGIIDCTLKELPAYFLRDRSRGALRVSFSNDGQQAGRVALGTLNLLGQQAGRRPLTVKDCNVGKINALLLHNIEEVRYMILEDTKVGKVESPLASSGTITLSKKEIHTWEGMEFINITFDHVASDAFNITHKDDTEKFSIKNSHFGLLETRAFSISGDLNVNISSSSFAQLDPLAIQVSANGTLVFSGNVIEMAESDSLLGLLCKQNSTLINNTVYVSSQTAGVGPTDLFRDECGHPKVSFILMELKSIGLSTRATSLLVVGILIVAATAVGLSYWGWRNRMLFKFHYRRNDVPLCHEEGSNEGEDEQPLNNANSATIQNPTFNSQKKLLQNTY